VVVLRGATVRGQLSLEKAELTGEGMCALAADGVKADADVFLTGMKATGADAQGVVRFLGAEIGGSLVCDGARVTSTAARGYAVDLRMMTLGRTLSMTSDQTGRRSAPGGQRHPPRRSMAAPERARKCA
jgi:hypothetical protein